MSQQQTKIWTSKYLILLDNRLLTFWLLHVDLVQNSYNAIVKWGNSSLIWVMIFERVSLVINQVSLWFWWIGIGKQLNKFITFALIIYIASHKTVLDHYNSYMFKNIWFLLTPYAHVASLSIFDRYKKRKRNELFLVLESILAAMLSISQTEQPHELDK